MKNFDDAVQELLEMFKSQDFPRQMQLTFIRKEYPTPSDKWSITNRLIMLLIGQTEDARTYKQWQAAGRQVQKGKKAFSIIAPIVKKRKKKDSDEEEMVIVGFRPLPVFRLEDTEGEPLPECNHGYEPVTLPPFFDAAVAMGIDVYWKPVHQNAYGYYRLSDKSITLCSDDYVVYFHELAHAVHDTIEPLKSVPEAKAEIVAELTASVLASMVGVNAYQQQAYEYIRSYVQDKDVKGTLKAITDVLNLVEKIVGKILAAAETANNR